MNGRRWLTAREVAEMFSIHPATVRRMIQRSELPAVRIGRAVRIDGQGLERILESQIKTNGAHECRG